MPHAGNIDVTHMQDAEYEHMFGAPYRQRKQLANAGVPVTPDSFERTLTGAELVAMKDALLAARENEESLDQVSVVGRIANIREHKRSAFVDLMDPTGRVQIYVPHGKLTDEQKLIYEQLSRGDFLGVHGKPFATRTGEPSVHAEELVMLGKALRTMPEIGTPIDVETQYRHRFMDLLLHPETRERFVLRSKVLKSIRDFMDEEGFMEVETPIVDSLATGALASPFSTHHKALDLDCQLRIAPEIPLKKLIVAGFEKIYEMGKQFRNEGMSTEHLQEFTTLEFYRAYANYETLMTFTEEWFREVSQRSLGKTAFDYDSETIDLSGTWPRKTFQELILEATGVDINEHPDQKDLEIAVQQKAGVDVSGKSNRGGTVDLIYKRTVRSNLIQPTFILGHTADLSPLARRSDTSPEHVDRFQVVMGGTEVVNAYSELVDPIDQRLRFESQSKEKERGDDEAHAIDHEYLYTMEHGMPPIAGWGVGIDRLVMMMADQRNVRDVVLFPIMKPKQY